MTKFASFALVALASIGSALSLSITPASRTVVVAGATGRVGRLVVETLLKQPGTTVRALVRSTSKATELLPSYGALNLQVVEVADLTSNSAELTRACVGASSAVWCATGFSDDASLLNKVKKAVGLPSAPKQSVDVAGVGCLVAALVLANKRLPKPNTHAEAGSLGLKPQLVMLSSAGVTRPSWPAAKKAKMPGAADIPIVRLNPGGVLGLKCDAEQVLRDSGLPYCVVRPTGLNEDWPPGRPVLSQGDVAVGRANKQDVAAVLAAVLDEPSANGKTFELFTLQGYPPPRSLQPALARLQLDATVASGGGGGEDEAAVFAQYTLLQQLLPGEAQDPTALEMGVQYEQVDTGEVAPRAAGAAATARERAVAAGVGGG